MNTQNITSTHNIVVKGGLYLGVTLALWELLIQVSGNNNSFVSIFFYLIIILGLITVHALIKRNVPVRLTYGLGFSVSAGVLLISILIHTVFLYLYLTFVDNSFLISMTEEIYQKLAAQNYSKQEIESLSGFISTFQNPQTVTIIAFLSNALLCLIIATVLGIFTKQKDELLLER